MLRGNRRPLLKDKKFLGYKYTEEEKNEMVEGLEYYKDKYELTTTEAIYNILTSLKVKDKV